MSTIGELIVTLRAIRRQASPEDREAIRLLIHGDEEVDAQGNVKKDANGHTIFIPGLERFSLGTPVVFVGGDQDTLLKYSSKVVIAGINKKGELEIKRG